MWPERVVLPAPAIGQDLNFRSCGEQLGVEEFIPKAAVVDEVERSSYDSEKLFSHEDPGSINSVAVPLPSHQFRRAWEMISGALSERLKAGPEQMLVSSSNTATTSLALHRLPTHVRRQSG
jgi:hypothetical protein